MRGREGVPSVGQPRWGRGTAATAVVALGLTLLGACAGGDPGGASAGSTTAPATTAVAVPCGTTRTVQYASYPGVDPNRTSLDVYVPPDTGQGCRNRPVVVWVHGGGWTSGDKSEFIADKVALFNGAGYVLAAPNYRLTDTSLTPPAPQYPVHNEDVGDAVAWLVDHAADYGGDPTRVAVLGHSAGGGITSAVATDPRYLGRHDLPLTTITCAGSMDGEGYDVVAGATTAPPEIQAGYRNIFGTDPAVWREASPIAHVEPGRGIAPFFIAARGIDWRLSQHLAFIDALRSVGVPVTVFDARDLEHADLSTEVGAPGDTTLTPALMQYLSGCLAPAPP